MSQPECPQREEDIPALAEQAIHDAIASAMAAGRSVLVTHDNIVSEVFPDGTKRVLTRIAPRTRIKPGVMRALPQ